MPEGIVPSAAESEPNETDRYSRLVNSMQEGFGLAEIILDDEGVPCDYRLLEVNEAFGRVTGFAPEQANGRTIRELVPDVEEFWIETFGDVALRGTEARFEAESPAMGKWFQVYAFRPEPGRFAHLFLDITDRKRRERELIESEARERSRLAELEALMDAFPAVVFLSRDPECKQMTGSRATYEMLRASPGTNVSKSASPGNRSGEFRAMKDGREIPPHDLPMQRAATGAAPVRDYEFDVVYDDGSSRTLYGNAVPLLDESGSPYGAVSAFVDITARRRTEQALELSERLAHDRLNELESIYHHAPVGLCVLDVDLRYVRINERLAELNGISVEEHLGRPLREIVPDVADQIEDGLRDVIRSGTPVHGIEISGETAAAPGLKRTWIENWWPVHATDGTIAGVSIVAQDITDRKDAERALQRLTATLEKKVAERTALAEARAEQLRRLAVELTEAEERERSRVAHLLHDDLQQLLAGAQLHLEAVRRAHGNDAPLASVRKLLEQAIDKSRRLSHELSPAVLHHSGLVPALEWLADQMREQFGLCVELATDGVAGADDASVKVVTFRGVQELLFNVVKHGETQSAEVSLSEQDGFLTVRVSDDGAGFDPESLDSALGSPGLGLLSLRERIRSIGGTLDIRSAPGEGSRIVLSVPRTLGPGTATDVDRPTDEPAVSDSSGRRPTRAGHELRVLVADDHHVMRQGLVSLVAEQPSIEVVGEASNGVEAVEMAKQLAPDVIVMDVSMPEMDGVEATRRVKRLFPRTRVIALTMYDDEQIEREMRSAGAEEFVNKAHSSANLLKAIYGLSDGE